MIFLKAPLGSLLLMLEDHGRSFLLPLSALLLEFIQFDLILFLKLIYLFLHLNSLLLSLALKFLDVLLIFLLILNHIIKFFLSVELVGGSFLLIKKHLVILRFQFFLIFLGLLKGFLNLRLLGVVQLLYLLLVFLL